MGLSASQARLLSITARLSQNELHSQQIANSKVRLADKSNEASREYLQSLNATKLVFTTYDAKGNATQTSMTAGLLYTYEPMKSQYTLQNAAGINYVTNVDATNYENTDNLYDFLNCYDLIANMEEYESEKANYDKQMQEYNTKKTAYDGLYETYIDDMEKYYKDLGEYNKKMAEYREKYEEWLKEKDKPQLYDKFSGFVGTSYNTNTDAGFCYHYALSGDTGCYKHLLAHLLDYGGGDNFSNATYTASNGKTTTLISKSGGMTSDVKNEPGWSEIVDAINDPSRKCDGDDDLKLDGNGIAIEEQDKENILKAVYDAGGTPTEAQILVSDYYRNADGSYGIKTLKQKAIDILYMLNNNINPPSPMKWKDTLINFTDGDMKNLSSAPEEPVFEGKMPEMPTPPTPPAKPTLKVKVNDLEKGQWYVNLWYMMNGVDSANVLRPDNDDTTNGNYVLEADEKSTASTKTYKVLDDNLMHNESWLKFAIEQGIVTVRKAQFNNPGDTDGTGIEVFTERITWDATISSAMTEVSEVQDDMAIARAEAEYNKKVRDIESKDKQYDLDIKKLDTEHNALQTEYESIQTVIQKNVDRSFKAFS